MGDALLAVQEFDSIVSITDFNSTLAIQFDASALVQPHVVVSQMNSHAINAFKVHTGRALSVQMNCRLKLIPAVMDLDAMPHRFGTSHCLDIQTNYL